MEKVKFYKNFSAYYSSASDAYFLKIETVVNGSICSVRVPILKFDYNKINKMIENYDNDIKEILEYGK